MHCEFIGWCALSAEEQAAWFQGIASVVAILIAIAVPAVQHALVRSEAKRAERLSARSMAMSLLFDFQAVIDRLNDVWGYEHPDNLEMDHPLLGIRARSALDIPPTLAAMSDRLHELGNAASAAQRTIYHLRRAREYVTSDTHGQEIVFDKGQFYDHLSQATGAVTGVLNLIDDMFEVPKAKIGKADVQR